ncbi:hypothetical protein KY290_028225 [Solanum tuberosum]|uniref:Uncharacterized protein n=1 Tax=Solanum tuberosum TaxID=4113 RepID=A0ABQ7UIH0_SOLTU|nr:hypothetical protein KY284_027193 [Solanum tuberosum]KAH0748993.1 hypothetical protein KY290_028225 [Solanum tuberosum]
MMLMEHSMNLHLSPMQSKDGISVQLIQAPYLRPAYEGLLDVYSEMEQVFAKECKSDRLYYAKHEMKLVSA